MRARLPGLAGLPDLLPGRSLLVGLAGLALALGLGLASGPVLEAVEAAGQIAAARERLARMRDAAARPPAPVPLAGPDADALLTRFRARLDGLAEGRAALVDGTEIELDPARPTLPRLRATLRGTAEGLHGLLHALESEAPLVAVEAAEIAVARAADAESGRPTLMQVALTARGVVDAPADASAQAPAGPAGTRP